MIGINFGSLNSSLSIGKTIAHQFIFKTELLLSETSLRTCPSMISFTENHRLIGDQASLILKKNLTSSFQYINRLIGFNPNIPFCQNEYKNYHYVGGKYDSAENKFSALSEEKLYPEEIIISYLHLLYFSYITEKNLESECE